MKKSSGQTMAKLIPHLYESCPVWEYADRDGLGKGICVLYEEIDAVIEEDIELVGTRDADTGE